MHNGYMPEENREGITRQRKDGSWEARYYLAGDPNPKSAYGPRKRDAEAKRRKILRELDEGIPHDSRKITVEQYLRRWMDGPLKQTVSIRTREDYCYHATKHLIPEIGKKKLKDLTAEDLDDLYARKTAAGLGPRSVGYIHSTIRVALQRAVKKRLLPYNVARDADPPSMAEAKKEYVTLTQEQVETFFEAAQGDRFEALFVVAVFAGPRPGELLGLKWEDLDLDRGAASIRRAVSETRGQGCILRNTTKTGRGRPVSLFPEVVAALKDHRRRHLEERLLYAEIWEETYRARPEAKNLVFPSKTGGLMSGSNLLTRHYKPILKRAGLPSIRLYDLRHTFATLWLESGEDVKVLQEVLGHSRISQTLDTYAHVSPELQKQSMSRFGARFRASRGAGRGNEADQDISNK